MNDKELLELAAKAAGYKFSSAVEVTGLWASINPNGCYGIWNPLDKDSDRYRLIKALKGNVYFCGATGYFEILSDSEEPPILESFKIGDEKDEAYAIVRAAAEIGRNMK